MTAFKRKRERQRLVSDQLDSTSGEGRENERRFVKHFTNTMQGRKKRGRLYKYSFELC